MAFLVYNCLCSCVIYIPIFLCSLLACVNVISIWLCCPRTCVAVFSTCLFYLLTSVHVLYSYMYSSALYLFVFLHSSIAYFPVFSTWFCPCVLYLPVYCILYLPLYLCLLLSCVFCTISLTVLLYSVLACVPEFSTCLWSGVVSKLEVIQGGGFRPSDNSIIEYCRYLNAHKDYTWST